MQYASHDPCICGHAYMNHRQLPGGTTPCKKCSCQQFRLWKDAASETLGNMVAFIDILKNKGVGMDAVTMAKLTAARNSITDAIKRIKGEE